MLNSPQGVLTAIVSWKGVTQMQVPPSIELLEPRLLLSAAPVVDTFTAAPNPATVGQIVHLSVTAHDPDPGEALTVSFYKDSSGNGQGEEAEVIGQDLDGSDGFALDWDTKYETAGAFNLLAVAFDPDKTPSSPYPRSMTLNPAPVDHPPVVDTFTAAPNPAMVGQIVHLLVTAHDPDAAIGDSVIAMNFYHDRNSDGLGTPAERLSTDLDGTDGWTFDWDTAGYSGGNIPLLAVAYDRDFSAGDPKPLSVALVHPGDANIDGKVDGGDLALWQQHYDPLGLNTGNYFGWGDFNGDGRINGRDLALWRQNYDPLGTLGTNEGTPVGVEASVEDEIVIDDPVGAVELTPDPAPEQIGDLGVMNVSSQPESLSALMLGADAEAGSTAPAGEFVALEPTGAYDGQPLDVEAVAESVASINGIADGEAHGTVFGLGSFALLETAEAQPSSALVLNITPASVASAVQLSPEMAFIRGSNHPRAYRPAIQPLPSDEEVEDIFELAVLNQPL